MEKLAVQIIKNLQIKISNIHIRLEDTHVDPKRPFSIGFTLHQLVFQVGQVADVILLDRHASVIGKGQFFIILIQCKI